MTLYTIIVGKANGVHLLVCHDSEEHKNKKRETLNSKLRILITSFLVISIFWIGFVNRNRHCGRLFRHLEDLYPVIECVRNQKVAHAVNRNVRGIIEPSPTRPAATEFKKIVPSF